MRGALAQHIIIELERQQRHVASVRTTRWRLCPRGRSKQYQFITQSNRLRKCKLPIGRVESRTHAALSSGRADCGSSSPGVEILIGVLSSPNNIVKRQAIRESWMQWDGVGQACVVQHNINKTTLAALVWVGSLSVSAWSRFAAVAALASCLRRPCRRPCRYM